MITKNGKNLQNLENSVQTLKELVERHYEIDRVLADLGITVVGTVLTETPAELGLVGTKWGEAYPERVGETLEYWVWTRPDGATEDVSLGVWLNIGPLAIPGPEGKGIKGDKGDPGPSTHWYVGTTPAIVSSPKLGDLFLKRSADATNGYVYEYTDRGWVYTQINLIGPEGSQGEPGIPGPEGKGEKGDKGDKGDPAPAIHILGVLSSLAQLTPLTPSDDYLGKGFIVKDGGFSYIYVCVISMEDPHNYVWENAGLLSGYTAITVGGNLVNEWNADTKLTKQTYTTTYPQIYVKNPTGGQEMRDAIDKISNTDKWPNHTKSIALRDSAGAVRGPSPVENDQYATKSYVDNNSGGTLYRHDIAFSGYGYEEGYDGDFGLGNTHSLYAKLTIYSTKANYSSSYFPIPSDYYNLLTNGPGPITIVPTEGTLDNNGQVMTLTFYPNEDIQIGIGYQGQVEEYYWIKGGFENGYQNHIVNRVI